MAEFVNILTVVSTLWVLLFSPVAAESVQNMSRTWFGNGFLNCGATSRLATININSAVRSSTGSCSYNIRPNVLRVCQLRIDFDTNLAPPRVTTEREYPHCVDDAIIIDGHPIQLCGSNSGQHIYVPWTVNNLLTTRRIEVRIANRDLNPTLPNPSWSLKITQITCRGPVIAREHPLKAPTGCDQYFTQPEGVLSSFNYNGGDGPYPGNLQYSICFQRQPQHVALNINPVTFEMSQTAPGTGYNTNCVPELFTAGAKVDFLSIAGARFTTAAGVSTAANLFCGKSLESNQILTVRSPGPFVLQFSSDEQTDDSEKGFRLRYNIV